LYFAFMPASMKSRVLRLTKRQQEVVRLTSLGCTQAEAGGILGLSPNTVDIHRTKAMKLLGVTKAALLTRVAIKFGISPLDDTLTRTEGRKAASTRRS
jgi:DNA-binding CsgD family transcriptional regulator